MKLNAVCRGKPSGQYGVMCLLGICLRSDNDTGTVLTTPWCKFCARFFTKRLLVSEKMELNAVHERVECAMYNRQLSTVKVTMKICFLNTGACLILVHYHVFAYFRKRIDAC